MKSVSIPLVGQLKRSIELVAHLDGDDSLEDIARRAVSQYCHNYLMYQEGVDWEWLRNGDGDEATD